MTWCCRHSVFANNGVSKDKVLIKSLYELKTKLSWLTNLRIGAFFFEILVVCIDLYYSDQELCSWVMCTTEYFAIRMCRYVSIVTPDRTNCRQVYATRFCVRPMWRCAKWATSSFQMLLYSYAASILRICDFCGVYINVRLHFQPVCVALNGPNGDNIVWQMGILLVQGVPHAMQHWREWHSNNL